MSWTRSSISSQDMPTHVRDMRSFVPECRAVCPPVPGYDPVEEFRNRFEIKESRHGIRGFGDPALSKPGGRRLSMRRCGANSEGNGENKRRSTGEGPGPGGKHGYLTGE